MHGCRPVPRQGFLVATIAAVALLAAAPLADAGSVRQPKRDAPAWYTPELHAQVMAAGAEGVQVPEEQMNDSCPGPQQRGVSAGGCVTYPYGCTANFIFAGGEQRYVGLARHCVDVDNSTGEPIPEGDGGNDTGTPVVMQVDTTTLARVGEVVKHTAGDGDPGEDFALVAIDPAVAAKWGVIPAIPVIGGPQGVYTGCAPEVVKHYGHGYGAATGPGYPRLGLATNWPNPGYGWTGFGLPGDSGSPVVLADGRAAGNFTHLVVDFREYPGSDLAGMRMTAILQFAGSGIELVNADGSTTRAASADCSTKSATKSRKPPRKRRD